MTARAQYVSLVTCESHHIFISVWLNYFWKNIFRKSTLFTVARNHPRVSRVNISTLLLEDNRFRAVCEDAEGFMWNHWDVSSSVMHHDVPTCSLLKLHQQLFPRSVATSLKGDGPWQGVLQMSLRPDWTFTSSSNKTETGSIFRRSCSTCQRHDVVNTRVNRQVSL